MRELYKSNAETLQLLLEALDEKGRGSFIQPGGTGTSTILMHLIAERPNVRFLIVCARKRSITRLFESWNEAGAGTDIFSRVDTVTYRNIANTKVTRTGYGAIVLDDFTLAGAPKVSSGLRLLFSNNSKALRIGCGTTRFRDTDGRDMARELFGAEPVVERDLVDAWKTGEFTRPLYISALYSAPSGLLGLDTWWSAADPRFREGCDEEYEAIRRSIGRIGCADAVIAKYLKPYPDARVVVFCSTIEHAAKQAADSQSMFGKVNQMIHAYEFHSDLPDPWGNLSSFESDTSSALKVLYCVDMLTEDVRLDGIRAIVMTRPTKSNAVFLSQIGRAISSRGLGKDNTAIIFDLVNNAMDDSYATTVGQFRIGSSFTGASSRIKMFLTAGCKVIDALGDPIGIQERVRKLEEKYTKYKQYLLQTHDVSSAACHDDAPIVCHETEELFINYMEAADWASQKDIHGVKPSQIKQALRTGTIAGGYHWRYFGEPLKKENARYFEDVDSFMNASDNFIPAPDRNRNKRETAADDRKLFESRRLNPRDYSVHGEYNDRVYRLSDGKVFSSVGAVAVAIGASPEQLQRAIKNRKVIFGTRFFYYHGTQIPESSDHINHLMQQRVKSRPHEEHVNAQKHSKGKMHAPISAGDGTTFLDPSHGVSSTGVGVRHGKEKTERKDIVKLIQVKPYNMYYRTVQDVCAALELPAATVKRALNEGQTIESCNLRYFYCSYNNAEKLLKKSSTSRLPPDNSNKATLANAGQQKAVRAVSPGHGHKATLANAGQQKVQDGRRREPAHKTTLANAEQRKDSGKKNAESIPTAPAQHASKDPVSDAIADITKSDGTIDIDFLSMQVKCMESGITYQNLLTAAMRSGTSLEALTESIRLGEPVDGKTWILV